MKLKRIAALFGLTMCVLAIAIIYPSLVRTTAATKVIDTSPQHQAAAAAHLETRRLVALAVTSNDLERASNLLATALLEYEGDPVLWRDQARVFELTGRKTEALSAYDKVINPSHGWGSSLQADPIVLGHYADLAAELNRADLATDAYARIRAVGRTSLGDLTFPVVEREAAGAAEQACSARTMVGIAYALRGEFEEATREFAKALDANPSCGVALYYRAHEYERASDRPRALADYRRALLVAGANERLRSATLTRVARLQTLAR